MGIFKTLRLETLSLTRPLISQIFSLTVLTKYVKFKRLAPPISLRVKSDTRVVSGRMSPDTLKYQRLVADYNTVIHIVLKYGPLWNFNII